MIIPPASRSFAVLFTIIRRPLHDNSPYSSRSTDVLFTIIRHLLNDHSPSSSRSVTILFTINFVLFTITRRPLHDYTPSSSRAFTILFTIIHHSLHDNSPSSSRSIPILFTIIRRPLHDQYPSSSRSFAIVSSSATQHDDLHDNEPLPPTHLPGVRLVPVPVLSVLQPSVSTTQYAVVNSSRYGFVLDTILLSVFASTHMKPALRNNNGIHVCRNGWSRVELVEAVIFSSGEYAQ